MSELKEEREIKKWRIIESSYLLKHKYHTVRKDHVVTQSGKTIPDWYVLEYHDWVNVVAITDDGLFVMERQYRHGLGIIEYEICAGIIEDGETPLQAAQRELKEETGYGEGNWELYNISSPNPSSMNNRNYTFLAEGVKRIYNQSLDETESIDVCLLSIEQVRRILDNNEIVEGIMQAPLWKYVANMTK